jgi:preprotein translocase subunit SecG
VVLLQQGKGGDIAAAFGGSSSQTAFGARAGATVLTRATAVLGTLFMLGAFALGVMNRGGGSSVVSGVQGAAPVATPNVPLPMQSGTPTPTATTTPAPTTTATPKPSTTATPPPGRSGGS